MSRWLGARRREQNKKAQKAGYVVEMEQVWEHRCEPPERGRGSVLGSAPILSNGDYAEVGTLWRCPECGKVNEVYCPVADKPGLRHWRVVSDDAVPDTLTDPANVTIGPDSS